MLGQSATESMELSPDECAAAGMSTTEESVELSADECAVVSSEEQMSDGNGLYS